MMNYYVRVSLVAGLCLSVVEAHNDQQVSAAENRTSSSKKLPVKDCQEYFEKGERRNGVYKIGNCQEEEFEVRCEFSQYNGWTVIQKRLDGSVNFRQRWDDYKYGFGSAAGEHWLGNERIHSLTQTNQKMNIYVKSADGRHGYATWSEMHVHDESDNYRLSISGYGYKGNLPMSGFFIHNNRQFSTGDRDNDNHPSYDCANHYFGGWWYNKCTYANLNGIYNRNVSSGVTWSGFSNSLVQTTMRLTRD